LSAIGSLKEYSDSLGDLLYNITEYRKVVLMTFPLIDGKILCISLIPGTDITNIKNQVIRIIGSIYRGRYGIADGQSQYVLIRYAMEETFLPHLDVNYPATG
jgi:hypothetical protein